MSLLANTVAVVKFKKLANELTETEFDLFLSKISKKIGKETILKLLCSPFMKSTSINNQQLLINDFIKIISNIIRSRKTKQIEETMNATKIDQLPSSLIGGIASYLKRTEYSLFSRLNRTIFVNCNTPNTLKKIDLQQIANYSSLNLQNYPQITYLSFKLHQFHQFPINKPSIPILNRLHTLIMEGNQCKDIDIQRFTNQKYLNLGSLQSTALADFEIDFTSFCELSSQLKMIQHLSLWSMNISGQIDMHKLSQLLPNLTSLSFIGGNVQFANAMITQYGSNLECLSLCIPRNNINCDHVNFSKLTRLLIGNVSPNIVNNILKTAKGLREIMFAPKVRSMSAMSTDEIKESIQKFIFDQSALEFLYIPTKPESLESICISIEKALYKTYKRKRENFEIGFEIDCRETFDAADFMINISRIIDKLNASNINNFMLRVDGEFDLKEMSKAVHDYIEFTPSVKLMKETKLGFIITNKHCKMHRHHKWWNDFKYLRFV